jgi:hypothetical protein
VRAPGRRYRGRSRRMVMPPLPEGSLQLYEAVGLASPPQWAPVLISLPPIAAKSFCKPDVGCVIRWLRLRRLRPQLDLLRLVCPTPCDYLRSLLLGASPLRRAAGGFSDDQAPRGQRGSLPRVPEGPLVANEPQSPASSSAPSFTARLPEVVLFIGFISMYYKCASQACRRIVSTMETKLSDGRSVEAAPRHRSEMIKGRRALVEGDGGLTPKNAEAPAEHYEVAREKSGASATFSSEGGSFRRRAQGFSSSFR